MEVCDRRDVRHAPCRPIPISRQLWCRCGPANAIFQRGYYKLLAMTSTNAAPSLDDLAKRAMDIYWKQKDLAVTVALLLEGIAKGQAAAAVNPADATQILGTVKAMAFNLASFTWPGWDEAGITITPQQMALGRDAADLNYQLALELNRPPDKVAAAHWLVGAHALAAGEFDRA